jgi:sRNA-binding protein
MGTLRLAAAPASLPPELQAHIAAKAAEAAQREAEAAQRQVEAERAAKVAASKAEYARAKRLIRDAGVDLFDRYCPLAIGIHKPLVELMAGKLNEGEIAGSLSYHVRRWRYLEAIVRGEPRRDLNGAETGFPTEEQQAHAPRELGRRPCPSAQGTEKQT